MCKSPDNHSFGNSPISIAVAKEASEKENEKERQAQLLARGFIELIKQPTIKGKIIYTFPRWLLIVFLAWAGSVFTTFIYVVALIVQYFLAQETKNIVKKEVEKIEKEGTQSHLLGGDCIDADYEVIN